MRSGPRRPEALAEGPAQPAAEDGRTPMVFAVGGYRVAPTATHRETIKPASSPESTPWERSPSQPRGAAGPAPSPAPAPLTGVLQAGRKIPRVKAPRRGPLRTPMTVKEPCGAVGGRGVTEGRATHLSSLSLPAGKARPEEAPCGPEIPLCLSFPRGGKPCFRLPWAGGKGAHSLP